VINWEQLVATDSSEILLLKTQVDALRMYYTHAPGSEMQGMILRAADSIEKLVFELAEAGRFPPTSDGASP
jgi:hypothetical protein